MANYAPFYQYWGMQGRQFDFDQHSVQFNSFYGPSGAISFSGRWQPDGRRYSLTMVPQGHTAQVTALTEQVSDALSEQELNLTAISAGKTADGLSDHCTATAGCLVHSLVQMHAMLCLQVA